MVALSPLAGRLSDTLGSRSLASLGMVIIGLSFIAMYYIYPITEIQLMIMLAFIGIGFGLFSAPNTNSVMGSAERKYSGIAAGFLGTMRFTGQLISISIATVIFAFFLPHSLIVGMFSGSLTTISTSSFDGFVHGLRIIMIISGILSLCGAGTSLMRNKSNQPPPNAL
jgi:MFS family permease